MPTSDEATTHPPLGAEVTTVASDHVPPLGRGRGMDLALRLLPRPAPGPATTFWRVFVKAFHSLAVLAMASASIYLVYCALTGRRDVFTVLSLVMIGVEAVVYATFGRACPLTILARNLGDEGGHDYLFEWLLGRSRIHYVARTLALLAVVGVASILVAELF
ncbi:MAG TPA: hypothetical protein VFF08_06140 [Trueperaceae bacterium]|nr:hypothetical protein [Trueperaceae bacterium]